MSLFIEGLEALEFGWVSFPDGEAHADFGYGDVAGVVHGLEFVVADEGEPREGFGGGAGAEVAVVCEPMDLLGAGCGVGLEEEAALLRGVGLDVVGEGGLGAENLGGWAAGGGGLG